MRYFEKNKIKNKNDRVETWYIYVFDYKYDMKIGANVIFKIKTPKKPYFSCFSFYFSINISSRENCFGQKLDIHMYSDSLITNMILVKIPANLIFQGQN